MNKVEVTKRALLEMIKLKDIVRVMDEIVELVERKNKDYGDAWQRYGIFTPLIRINDKILRVKTLLGGVQALVSEENIEDTLVDIIGYTLLALLWLKHNPEKDLLPNDTFVSGAFIPKEELAVMREAWRAGGTDDG